jgi:hypothetical protein
MTLSTIQRTIRVALVMLISATVVVACGPDKHKHRMPMKTGQKAINPKTGLPYTAQETAEQQKKQNEDLKNRRGKIETIEKKIEEAKNYKPLDKNSLAEGTYTLDKVTVYYKYINGSDEMRIYREHGIQNYKLTEVPGTYMAASFVASFSDTPRFIEVPLKFIVDRSQNQDWTAAGDAAFPQVVNLYSVAKQITKDMTHDLDDDTDNIDQKARVKAGVANMLVSATFTDSAYSLLDENGKKVTMRLLDVSKARLNIAFDIDEAGPKPLKARTIVLSYAIEKKAAAQATGTPAASNPDPGAPTSATTPNGQLASEQGPGNEQMGAAPVDNGAAPADAVPGVDDDQANH